MAEDAAGRQAEDNLMDLVARNVDPVSDFARIAIAPEVPRHARVRNGRRSIEGRTRRRLIAHSARPGSCARCAFSARSDASGKRGGSNVLSIGSARPLRPDSIVLIMISSAW